MTEKTDPLLTALRDQFTHATCGETRARTATFINPNLQDLGQREWMEGGSLDAGRTWALKTMVWSPNSGQPTIRQIEKDNKAPLNFGAMLYHLEEYERGQDALGFLRDEDDTGMAAGAPLFYTVAAEEGIPQNAQGRLIVPQQGQIVGSGEFPVEAFAIAAKLAPAKPQLPAVVGREAGGPAVYVLSRDARSGINSSVHFVQGAVEQLNDRFLGSLMGRGWSGAILPFTGPFLRSNSRSFFKFDYSLRYKRDVVQKLHSSDMPTVLYHHIVSCLDMADLVARRLVLSGLMRSVSNKIEVPAWVSADIEENWQGVLSVPRGVADYKMVKSFLNKDRLATLDYDLERQYIAGLSKDLSSLLSQRSVDLSALKTEREIVESAYALRPLPQDVPKIGSIRGVRASVPWVRAGKLMFSPRPDASHPTLPPDRAGPSPTIK